MLNLIENSALLLAKSTDGNPALAVVVVMLFYVMFDIFESFIEKLIWGDRFTHWLDPVFVLAFIAYAGYAVYACAVYNSVSGK